MDNLVEEFNKKESILKSFEASVSGLIMSLLNAKQFNIHQVHSRTKTRESLMGKLQAKPHYTSLDQITDLVGCRIITYFDDDVDKVAKIIEAEFQIDFDNSVDKRKVDYDRFGYQSLHFVASLNTSRINLSEYNQFSGLKFEIQIRSILQHSWAEIEHDLGYKGRNSIPDIVKRRFSRISALLETADIEFAALRKELKSYESNLINNISENPSSVGLDKASLKLFILNDESLKKVDSIIADSLNSKLSFNPDIIENLLVILEFAGIKTIYELQVSFKKNVNCIINFSEAWRIRKRVYRMEMKGVVGSGISLYDFAYFIISKNKTKAEFVTYFESRGLYYSARDVHEIFNALGRLSSECR